MSIYLRRMLAGILMICMHIPLYAENQSFELSIDDWVRPKNGAAVVQFTALQQTVDAWSRSAAGSVIEIRYPGGESGVLLAQELVDWLVAGGVPSAQLRPVAGNAHRDRIMLVIESGK
jgi:hypothetical protein